MAGMRRITQAVDDPEIEIFEISPTRRRDVADIGRIGGIADAITERRNVAVLHDEGRQRQRAALPLDAAAFAGLDRMMVEDRRVVAARRRDETVGKPQQDVLGGRPVQVDRNAPALVQHDRTQVIDAMGLVGMLMGQEHRVDVIDLGVDQLLAQVGRGVDHDPRHALIGGPLGEQRAAAAAIFRVGGIARPPPERRTGNTGRGPAAEDRQPHRHAAAFGAGTLSNRRKKFSVVWREISSSETPRASASTFATSTTYAGSLRLPRNLPGARYGASVSTMMRSAGNSAASSRSACDFLNVRMPVNEIERPSAIAFIASSRPPV